VTSTDRSPLYAAVVRAGAAGFEPATAQLLVGQPIVLVADTPARFVVGPAAD
jgi:hypothetical protein